MSILGLNGATIPGADLGAGIRAAMEAGFAAFEPRVPLLARCEERQRAEQVLESFRGSRMQWLPLNALDDVFAMGFNEVLAHADRVFSLAARFRVPEVILVPGKVEKDPPQDEALRELRALSECAHAHGISVLYELIGFPTHAFHSLTRANALVASAGIPLVLDTFHLAVSKASLEGISELSPETIGLVHLSDAILAGKAPEQLRDEGRVLPGEGGLPLVEILGAIRRTGYCGRLSVEVFHPKYGKRAPDEVAREAHQRALEVMQAAGWQLP